MSAGNFDSGKYERDSGVIMKCRPQPEDKDMVLAGKTNAYPSGNVTSGNLGYARLSGSRRRFGVHARYVVLRWTAGAPIGYKDGFTVRVPIFKKSVFDDIVDNDPATGTYLGTAVEVVSSNPEKVR